MDSDDDYYDDGDLYDDSGNESPAPEDGSEDEENFIMDAGFEDEPSGSSSQKIEEEYHFEVGSSESRLKKSYFLPILGPQHRGHCQSHG